MALAGCFLEYAFYVAALFAGARLLPGASIIGRAEPDGTRWTYRINGMALFFATQLAVATGVLVFDFSLAPLVDHFWCLFLAATLFSLAAALLLYRRARPALIAAGRDPAHLPWTSRFMGIELNPRWLGVDLKMFAYLPSLIGLGLLVAAFAFAQFERYGTITPQMGLFVIFWWIYLATHFQYEEFMLATWDVIAENFGFGLLWGDLALVPFFYCIAGWTLVDQLEPISTARILALSALFAFGLWVFRGSNLQKHRFKNDPRAVIWGSPAETLDGKLLVSGWWGIGRHLNYTGEIIVYLAITLTAGFDSFVPYLLPLWMCGLLAHRALRDDRRCRAKYGELWQRYCERARFRMVPGLY